MMAEREQTYTYTLPEGFKIALAFPGVQPFRVGT